MNQRILVSFWCCFCFVVCGLSSMEDAAEPPRKRQRQRVESKGDFDLLPEEVLRDFLFAFCSSDSLARLLGTNSAMFSFLNKFRAVKLMRALSQGFFSQRDKNEALSRACCDGDVVAVKLLLQKGADLWLRGILGRPRDFGEARLLEFRAIDWAVIHGHLDVVKVIVHHETWPILSLKKRLDDGEVVAAEKISEVMEKQPSFLLLIPGMLQQSINLAFINASREGISEEERDRYNVIATFLSEKEREYLSVRDEIIGLGIWHQGPVPLRRQNCCCGCEDEMLYSGALVPVLRQKKSEHEFVYIPARSLEEIVEDYRRRLPCGSVCAAGK